ncbi:GNAT family N-acetyltransferase [Gracilibacillus dipsosauri]|uniref:GNAT family N-acetyltransferase n=1 Tax=Gracilibacillus dipsosauri TaxID=178340 RepID=UPI002408FA69
MTIRMYTQGDEIQIQQLYTKVFHKERSNEMWKWKFLNHPTNVNPFILVFEEEGKILGHISLWVANAYINGEQSYIGLRIDTMVDPDARGKGIYRKLNESLLEEAKEHGIMFLYGFPAEKAKEILLATTNGIHVTDVTRYMMVVNPQPLGEAILPFLKLFRFMTGVMKRKIKPVKLPHGFQIEKVTHCNKQFDQLASDLKSFRPIMLKRDAAYLNWRYFEHPEKEYEILVLKKDGALKGYIVVKKEEQTFRNKKINAGFIVDMLAYDEQELWNLLMKAVLYHLKDMDIIQAWSFPETPFASVLTLNSIKEKDRPMPFVVHNLTDDQIGANISDWWVTQGDVDSF